MLDEAVLKLSVHAARDVAAGRPYARTLVAGLQLLIGADSGVTLTECRFPRQRCAPAVTLTVDGVPPPTDAQLEAMLPHIPQHPSFTGWTLRGPAWTHRLSDVMEPARYWELPAYQAVHGFHGGRYASGLRVHDGDGRASFVGMIRTDRDFTDAEMQRLAIFREPFASALAFRSALDDATALLPTEPDGTRQLTRREGEVLSLIARGWTRARVARNLSIAERTVRKHLESVCAKTDTHTRAEAIAWWVEHRPARSD